MESIVGFCHDNMKTKSNRAFIDTKLVPNGDDKI